MAPSGLKMTVPLLALLLLVLVLGTESARATVESESTEEFVLFKEWATQFDKQYPTNEQMQLRYAIFQTNLDRINKLNSMNLGAQFALNQFADLSESEFSQTRLLPQAPFPAPQLPPSSPRMAPQLSSSLGGAQLPDTWDWRAHGAVGPVRDQGSVGSCWAFSTVGNIEGQWFLANHSFVQLSPEQLVDCDYKNCGVFGGWPYLAMEYIIEAGGLLSEADYPYCSGFGKCYPCMANKNKTFCGPPPSYCSRNCTIDPRGKAAATISSWLAISSNESEIAAQLVTRGPLSVLLNAAMLQFYHHGIYDPPNWLCDPKALDHAVLLVGYGVEKTITGTKLYWLVQNSWGSRWGESGLFRILRGTGKCGINTGVTSAIV